MDAIEEKAPSEVLYRMALQIQTNYQDERRPALNILRKISESMCRNIKTHQIYPISDGADPQGIRPLDELDDELELGEEVLISPDGGKSANSRVVVTGFDKVTGFGKETKLNITWKANDGKEGTTARTDVSARHCTADDIVTDIIRLADDRGLRNMVHVDREPIINLYAKRFAQHYGTILRAAKVEMLEEVRRRFEAAFSSGIGPTALPVAKKLRADMLRLLKDVETRAKECIEAMEQYNSTPDLISTPNTHYLNELIKKMVEEDDSMATDDGGARHIYHNIRVFIKVLLRLQQTTPALQTTYYYLLPTTTY